MNNHLVYLLLAQRKYKEAEKELKKVLAQHPDDPDMLFLLGVCLIEQEKLDAADKIIDNGLRVSPNDDYGLFLKSRIAFDKNDYSKAREYLNQAVTIDPNNPKYYSLLSNIALQEKKYEKSLEYANKGLELEPENIACLNLRTAALFKLKRKEEAFVTIEKALAKDPENEFTHINVGFTYLEHNEPERALIHFREALRLDPNNQAAKSGMVEAMKAKYWFYRQFLRYAFWMAKLSSQARWGLILGAYLLINMISRVDPGNVFLQLLINLLVYVYIAFVLTTWLINPISNLLLRINVYGRYALTKDETRSSNFVGVFLVSAILSGFFYLFTFNFTSLLVCIFSISMMILTGSMLNPSKKRNKQILIGYVALMGVIGIAAILLSLTNSPMSVTVLYFFLGGFLLYQFLANGMSG